MSSEEVMAIKELTKAIKELALAVERNTRLR